MKLILSEEVYDKIVNKLPDLQELNEQKLCARGKRAAKAKYDRYPSAYANGYAVQVCKGQKPDASGEKKKSFKENDVKRTGTMIEEDLDKWFKERWVRIKSDGTIGGKCGTSKDSNNPDRCLPLEKAKSLTKLELKATAQKKKREGGSSNQFVSNTEKAKVKHKN